MSTWNSAEYRPASWIYVVQMGGDDGPVKIGFSTNPYGRLRALSAANPMPLKLLTTLRGDKIDESLLHRRFNMKVALSLDGFGPDDSLVWQFDVPADCEEVVAGIAGIEGDPVGEYPLTAAQAVQIGGVCGALIDEQCEWFLGVYKPQEGR